MARSGGDGGVHHAVHDPVRRPRRAGQAAARRHEHAQPGRVVERVEGPSHVHVHASEEREVPRRLPGQRRGREVLVRALQRRQCHAAEGQGQGRPDRLAHTGALRSEGAVARLHALLRHHRLRRRLDRPQALRRQGRRGRLQEGADRRGPLSRRVLQPRRGDRPRGVRRLLAQGAEHQAPCDAHDDRGDHARGRAEAGRGRSRVSVRRARRRGAAPDAGHQAGGAAADRRVLARVARAVGSEVTVARPPGAPGRQPRPRPSGDQPGRDARLLTPHGQHRPAHLPVRDRDGTARL